MKPTEEAPAGISRGVVVFCLAVAVPLALLVTLGSYFAVPVVYAVLFVEGDVIAYLIIRAGRVNQEPSPSPAGASSSRRTFLGSDRVDALASLVKWAGRGSDYSRRELALVSVKILAQSPESTSRLSSDRGFSEALRTVVLPYRDDPLVRAEISEAGDRLAFLRNSSEQAVRKAGRGRYISNLDAMVSKLELQSDGSGRVAQ